MDLTRMLESLRALQTARSAYYHAMAVLQTDGETAAPAGAAEARGETMAFLDQKCYELLVNDQTRELLDGLWEKKDELDGDTLRQVELLRKELNDFTRIPMEEVVEYSRLRNNATAAWVQAKANNDYASFEPYLEKLIAYKRRLAAYLDPDRPAYDVLLDDYEKGMNTEVLDEFFSMLRKEIVPLIEKVRALPPKPDFISKFCSV